MINFLKRKWNNYLWKRFEENIRYSTIDYGISHTAQSIRQAENYKMIEDQMAVAIGRDLLRKGHIELSEKYINNFNTVVLTGKIVTIKRY